MIFKVRGLMLIASFLLASALKLTGENTIIMNSPLVEVDKKFPGIDILPPGSVLDEVSMPRYEDKKLSLLVTAPEMKVESRVELSGGHVNAYIYDDFGSLTSRIYMQLASYFFDTGLLISKKHTVLKDIRLDMEGSGMVFDKEREIGMVKGPVTTVLRVNKLKEEEKK